MGVKLWSRQEEILRAVAANPRVAVRSGHKIGKSTAAVVIALWWVVTRKRARVIMTSASYRQVKSILWKELRRIAREAKVNIGGKLAEDPETGLQLSDGREVVGFSTDKPERMAGISGANVLFIVDEGSGVPEQIFEAIEGNRAGGARVVMFSNPTQTSGTFYDAFNGKREFWFCIHVSSEETPNVVKGRVVIPGLATREWVEEKRREWGEESVLFAVRVRGNFPKQGDNVVIALGLVEAAVARWSTTEENGVLELGVDVAEFGDDESVITPRRGHKALVPTVEHGMDSVQLAGKVREVAFEMVHKDDTGAPSEVVRVKVDVIGVGSGCAANLLAYELEWLEVVRVNASESATGDEGDNGKLANVRAQLWVGMRDWLKEGGAIPPDSKLEGELVAPRYSFDTQGRMKIEAKKDFKKRLGRSPDRADSLALAVYRGDEGWLVSA